MYVVKCYINVNIFKKFVFCTQLVQKIIFSMAIYFHNHLFLLFIFAININTFLWHIIVLVTGYHFKMAICHHAIDLILVRPTLWKCIIFCEPLYLQFKCHQMDGSAWFIVAWAYCLFFIWIREYGLVHNLANCFYHVYLLKIIVLTHDLSNY